MNFRILSRVGATLALLLVLSLPAAAQISDVYVLPAMANKAGGADTYWVNDLHVMNPQTYPLTVRLTYVPTGAGQASTGTITLNPNETWWAENILEEFDVVNATGALIVLVDPADNPTVPNNQFALSVVVQSRSFTRTPLPTVGQGVAPMITGLLDIDLDGISALASGVRNWGVPGSSGFRTNIGGVNLARVSTNLWVRVFDDNGIQVWDGPFTINPQTHYQQALPVTIQHGTVEFWVDFPAGYSPQGDDIVIPYASVVDNKTGDPTFMSPVLFATPEGLWCGGVGKTSLAHHRISPEAARRAAAGAKDLGEAKSLPGPNGKQTRSWALVE